MPGLLDDYMAQQGGGLLGGFGGGGLSPMLMAAGAGLLGGQGWGGAIQGGMAAQQAQRKDMLQNLLLRQRLQSDARDFAFRQDEAKRAQTNADRMFGLQQAQFNRREEPENVRAVRAAGIDPTSPEGRKALFPRTDTPISATDKKEIIKAEDDVPRLEATIRNMQRAKELNPQVYEGFGASMRGSLGAKAPDWLVPDVLANPKAGKATAEWDQIMGQEAIQMMGETLKGASTDFEMRKFLGIAADTSLPGDTRKNAMDRFLALANDELALRKRRAKEIRGGTYFKPEGGGAVEPAAPAALPDPLGLR
jgi:hypothetical protein